MSADQVAEIAPFIRELLDHAREKPASERELCATYEVVGVSGAWAQVTPTELNVAYPSARPPEEELREILQRLPAAQLLSWEPGKFATWSFASTNPMEIARVVDHVLAKLFNLGDYSIDAQLERL